MSTQPTRFYVYYWKFRPYSKILPIEQLIAKKYIEKENWHFHADTHITYAMLRKHAHGRVSQEILGKTIFTSEEALLNDTCSKLEKKIATNTKCIKKNNDKLANMDTQSKQYAELMQTQIKLKKNTAKLATGNGQNKPV